MKVYQLFELKRRPNGQFHREKLKEFKTKHDLKLFKDGIQKFRPETILEYKLTNRQEPEYMSFLDRLMIATTIDGEIKMFMDGQLSNHIIKKRLQQLSKIIIENKLKTF